MKTTKQLNRDSVFLCLVLRHRPEMIGIHLDAEGYTPVETLLERLAIHGQPISLEELQTIVETDEKGRYTMESGLIRCNQGHSSKAVSIQFTPGVPPANLYHGTTSRHHNAILKQGLISSGRHYVHLSTDLETAKQVGGRHVRGDEHLIVFQVAAQISSVNDGTYFLSDNGVWLTKHVDPRYLVELKL